MSVLVLTSTWPQPDLLWTSNVICIIDLHKFYNKWVRKTVTHWHRPHNPFMVVSVPLIFHDDSDAHALCFNLGLACWISADTIHISMYVLQVVQWQYFRCSFFALSFGIGNFKTLKSYLYDGNFFFFLIFDSSATVRCLNSFKSVTSDYLKRVLTTN